MDVTDINSVFYLAFRLWHSKSASLVTTFLIKEKHNQNLHLPVHITIIIYASIHCRWWWLCNNKWPVIHWIIILCTRLRFFNFYSFIRFTIRFIQVIQNASYPATVNKYSWMTVITFWRRYNVCVYKYLWYLFYLIPTSTREVNKFLENGRITNFFVNLFLFFNVLGNFSSICPSVSPIFLSHPKVEFQGSLK